MSTRCSSTSGPRSSGTCLAQPLGLMGKSRLRCQRIPGGWNQVRIKSSVFLVPRCLFCRSLDCSVLGGTKVLPLDHNCNILVYHIYLYCVSQVGKLFD